VADLVERCKIPQWVWAKSQPTNDLVHIGVKSAALVSAVFVDFSRNKFNFLHKNKLDIVWRVQFLTGRRPTRSFAPGTVATIALWKLAPMCAIQTALTRHHAWDGVTWEVGTSWL